MNNISNFCFLESPAKVLTFLIQDRSFKVFFNGGGAFLTLIKNPTSATPPHPPPKKARTRKAGMSKKEKGSSDIWNDLKSASHLIALASDDFHTE